MSILDKHMSYCTSCGIFALGNETGAPAVCGACGGVNFVMAPLARVIPSRLIERMAGSPVEVRAPPPNRKHSKSPLQGETEVYPYLDGEQQAAVMQESFEMANRDFSPKPAPQEVWDRLERMEYIEVGESPAALKACPICRDDYENGQRVVRTRCCGNVIHESCMLDALVMSDRCPLCRSQTFLLAENKHSV